MDEKIVKTIKGEKHPEKNCRLIDSNYYLIGNNKVEDSGDVYLINGRYIRASTGRVVFDHFEEEYKLKNASLVEGIIGTDGEEITLGYFTRNDLYNVKVMLKDMSERIAIAPNILNYAFREKRTDGIFYHISLMEAAKFNMLRGISREVKESLPYDSKNSIAKVMKTYESNYNPIICQSAEIVGQALKNYTFGLEFETCAGIVPNSKLNFLPLIPLRDGSIDGLEYATVPLQGPKGVQAIVDCAEELKRRTDFNEGCSLHLHIGGMPRTVEFVLAFYKLMSLFQNEMFSMFPLYKKYNFGIKRKNYSAPFPFEQINFKMDPIINSSDKKALFKNFDPLFIYLSGGHSFGEYNNDLANVQNHPQDPAGNQKWNIKHRYSYINFIPLIFGNHQTIEFRIHTPTYDANKIIDFLMLNTFLIDYATTHSKQILSGNDIILRRYSLHAFLDEYIPNYIENNYKTIYSELSHYITERRVATENLTRDGGVSYTEKEVRTSKYLKFNTYKFRRKVKGQFELDEIVLESPFGKNPFARDAAAYAELQMAEAKMRAQAAIARAQANSGNRKERRVGKQKPAPRPGVSDTARAFSDQFFWGNDPLFTGTSTTTTVDPLYNVLAGESKNYYQMGTDATNADSATIPKGDSKPISEAVDWFEGVDKKEEDENNIF